MTLKVSANGGAPTGSTSVVLNVTATAANKGFVTVWPCDQPRPTASNLNLEPGDTRPNLVVTGVSATDTVCLFTQTGAHLVADLEGWSSTVVPMLT